MTYKAGRFEEYFDDLAFCQFYSEIAILRKGTVMLFFCKSLGFLLMTHYYGTRLCHVSNSYFLDIPIILWIKTKYLLTKTLEIMSRSPKTSENICMGWLY
jgi:hypothetical protein